MSAPDEPAVVPVDQRRLELLAAELAEALEAQRAAELRTARAMATVDALLADAAPRRT